MGNQFDFKRFQRTMTIAMLLGALIGIGWGFIGALVLKQINPEFQIVATTFQQVLANTWIMLKHFYVVLAVCYLSHKSGALVGKKVAEYRHG